MKRTHLTDWFFLWVVCSQALGLVSVALPILWTPYLVSLLAGLIWVSLDHRTLFKKPEMRGAIKCPTAPTLGTQIELKVEIKTRDTSLLRLSKLSFRLQANSPFPLNTPEQRASPKKEEKGVLSYESTIEVPATSLGYCEVNHIEVWGYSKFGLWFRTVQIEIPKASFRVIPPVRKISEQRFRERTADQKLLFQGSRRSLRGRVADQFHSVRKYEFPDERRHVDARKTAKFGQLMTRTYDAFYDHHIVLGLDLGRSTYGSLGNSSKLDYYLSACFGIANNAIESRDRVSFFAFSQKVHFMIHNTRDLSQFQSLYRGHPELVSRAEESNFDILLPTISQLTGQRSLFILFTDLTRPTVQEGLAHNVGPICQRHLTTLAGLIDDEFDLEEQLDHYDQRKHDIESYNHLLYSYWIKSNFNAFKRKMSGYGGGTLLASENDWMGFVYRLYFIMRQSLNI